MSYIKFFIWKWFDRGGCPHFCFLCKYRKRCWDELNVGKK